MEIQDLNNLLKEKTIFSEDELALSLNLHKKTLRTYRRDPSNPLQFSRIGRKVYYTRDHIIQFFVNQIIGLSKTQRIEMTKQLKDDLSN